MVLRIEMLGTARVSIDGDEKIPLKSTLRNQALSYLACVGDWVSRDRLGFLFWADRPDQTARHNVRQLLKRIRRLDWVDGLEVEGDNVRWLVRTDLEALGSARDGSHSLDVPRTGALLPGFERGASYEFEEWLLSERRRVHAEWQDALVRSFESADRGGRLAEGARLLESALDEITDERILILYMESMARLDNPESAVSAYARVTERWQTELGSAPSADAQQLFSRLQEGKHVDASAVSPVVGRTRETVEILGLLARPGCRFLTLLGPGGIGKSTLAHLVAETASSRFNDGATLVSLESLSDADSIAPVIAAGVGVELDSRLEPLDQLVSVLNQQNLLLIVDNVEHLPSGWLLLSELGKSCPHIKITVTSRERLRLDEEWVYEVEGLSPPAGAELLLQRARQVAPDIQLSELDAQAISRRVGGSPLGIELAVPWLRVMSATEIINEVLEEPSMLRGGSRDKPVRHRSLDATMSHSWRLLPDDERLAIEALSVFAGPFTRKLAYSVANADAVRLRDLADKSLIGFRQEGLYASHPLVRQYASAQLATDLGRRSEVRARHARATLDLLRTPDQAIAHRRHLDDIVEGWRYAITNQDTDLIGRAADGLTNLLVSTGRIEQGWELFSQAVTTFDDGSPGTRSVLAALREGQSRLMQSRGRYLHSLELATAAVEAASGARDEARTVSAQISLAWARKWTEGDSAQHATLLEALPIARSLGNEGLLAEVLRGLGCSAPTLEQCRFYLTNALERATNSGQLLTRCRTMSALGSVLWGLGQPDEAVELHEELLHLARDEGIVRMVMLALIDLAFLHGERGHLDRALELAEEVEALSAGTEFIDLKISAAQVVGEILRLSGQSEASQSRVLEGLRLVRAVGLPPFGLRSLRLHGQLLIDRGEVEEGLGILALVRSWTRRGPDFTAWILDPRIWEENTRTADPRLVERARAWGETQDLEEVVTRVLTEVERNPAVSPPL